MRRWKKIRASLLALSMTVLAAGQTVLASDTENTDTKHTGTEYTYTVRLYAGNQGILTGEGIDAPGADIEKVAGRDGQVEQIVIRGVRYGQEVYIYPGDAAKVTDDRYYIKGIRRSGRDNSEAVASTGIVASDVDYVIAYGVSGEMAAYTVNYRDAAGNTLRASDTYYGNIGERQYVSARYIEGYRPQAYNMVKTLSANEAENVFDFVYTPVTASAETPAAPAGTTAGTGTGTAAGTTGATAGAAGANAGAAGTDAGAAGTDAETAEAEAPEGIGGDVTVPDEDVPQGVQDIDDDPVPLAEGMKAEQPTVMGYMPIYIGIGAAAVLALIGMAFYLRKRRKATVKKLPQEIVQEFVHKRSDDGK